MMKPKKTKDTVQMMVELPLTRIKESLPRMTFYKQSGNLDNKPAAIMLDKVNSSNSRKQFRNRKRSMSASSQNSRRSFRATRKQPMAALDGPSDQQISKFRPSGEKFVK